MDEGNPASPGSGQKVPLLDFAYFCFCLCLVLAYPIRWFIRFFKHNLLLNHSPSTFFASDFVVFYQAGKMVLKYGDRRIYDFDLQLAMFNQLIAPAHSERMFAVPYPPHFFLLMSPFALLPMESAFLVFVWSTYALGLFSFYKVSELNKNLAGKSRLLLLLAVASTLLAGQVLELGQPTWIICSAFALFLISICKQRDFLTALAFAIASIKPQHACLLGVMMLACGRWRAILYAALLTLGLAAVSSSLLGFDTVLQFPQYLISNSVSTKYVGICPDQQVCLRGLLSQCMDWSIAFKISVALFVPALVYMVWVWWKVRGRTELYPWAYALSMALAVVFLPHCHAPDTLLLALGVAATVPTLSPSAALKLENPRLRFYNCVLFLYPIAGFIVFSLWQLIYNYVHVPTSILNILVLASLIRIFHADILKPLKEEPAA